MQENNAGSQQDSAQQAGSLPFFARFLEGQNDAERSAATRKYPSDVDEYMTMKYPSDDDEGGDDTRSSNALQATNYGPNQTLKYPSDRDEWESDVNS
ncbi:MAG: Serine endopeptidase inhibitor [Blastocatellia bacterium]|jgi:hypothetical protein|nr:Serine endopeptidase inhibitor [Blastocatellia bacterium]